MRYNVPHVSSLVWPICDSNAYHRNNNGSKLYHIASVCVCVRAWVCVAVGVCVHQIEC